LNIGSAWAWTLNMGDWFQAIARPVNTCGLVDLGMTLG